MASEVALILRTRWVGVPRQTHGLVGWTGSVAHCSETSGVLGTKKSRHLRTVTHAGQREGPCSRRLKVRKCHPPVTLQRALARVRLGSPANGRAQLVGAGRLLPCSGSTPSYG
jgi:hypothetical protein